MIISLLIILDPIPTFVIFSFVYFHKDNNTPLSELPTNTILNVISDLIVIKDKHKPLNKHIPFFV